MVAHAFLPSAQQGFSRLRRTILNRLSLLAAAAAIPGSVLPGRAAAAMPAEDVLDRLRREIQGQVVPRSASSYELARQTLVWQQIKPPRFPELIVHAESIADVVAIVAFARANGLRVAIRCGGHSYDASSLEDGTILLDLSMLREIVVEPDGKTITAQPAVRAMDLVQTLAGHGLAFPAAHCGNVPLGGFLLGGGLGWNGEEWGGMSCFNIAGIDVVTANGRLLTADAENNPDLLWAARGGGPNFPGIVTRFRLAVYPNPSVILTSTYVVPLREAATVAAWVASQAANMPVNTEILLILADATGALPGNCNSNGKVLFVQATVFAHDAEQGRAALEPLAGLPSEGECLSREEYKPTPFDELYKWDATAYPQWRWAVDCLWTDSSPGSFMDHLVTQAEAMPSVKSSVLLLLKPHTGQLPDAAFSMIGKTYVASYAIWSDPEQDAANRAWVDRTMQLMRAHTKGHYINESAYVDHAERNPGSYAAASWGKLQAIKSKWDPDNLFHTYADRLR